MGPWLVPFHDERQIADIRLTTRVNGELRQDDRTSRMIFGFRFLISYISTFVTLQPGDVLVTGRSVERRVGNECVSTCRSRWWPLHYKQHITQDTIRNRLN